MRRSLQLHLVHGAIGGLVAGAVVAAWFLLVDLFSAEAFRTPAFLASLVLGEGYLGPSARLVLTYSVLHFGVFAVLGVAAGLVLRSVEAEPSLLAGAVFGVGILNSAHYGGLLVANVDFLTALPVGHVLLANLAGGLAIMAYLHRALQAEQPLGWRVLEGRPVLLEGIVAGLLGATAVALWFLIVDIVAQAPFRTPAALGSAVFLGVTDLAQVNVSVGVVAAYTVLHLAVFAVVGVAFAWTADRVRRVPTFWLLAVLAFIVLDALFIGVAAVLSEWVLGALGWWAVGIGNVAAVATMGGWLWRRHPELEERLRHPAAREMAA